MDPLRKEWSRHRLERFERVWFTLSHGILNEVYYPRIDLAAIRDMGLIVTDGQDLFFDEKREALVQLTLSNYSGRYTFAEIIHKVYFPPTTCKSACREEAINPLSADETWNKRCVSRNL